MSVGVGDGVAGSDWVLDLCFYTARLQNRQPALGPFTATTIYGHVLRTRLTYYLARASTPLPTGFMCVK